MLGCWLLLLSMMVVVVVVAIVGGGGWHPLGRGLSSSLGY